MFTFGAVSKRFDPRVVIAMGALLTAGTGLLLSDLNPNTGVATIFWPLILRSVGSVMIFLPLSVATLGPLPTKDIAGGSGIYSLTRQLGSSVGIALITTLLQRRTSLHRAILVEKVSEFRDAALTRIDALATLFPNHAADPIGAHHYALGIIDSIVNSQASLLSYADIFSYVAITFVVTLPVILLLGGKQDKKSAEAAAAAAH
jgi:DHA2 family multidrug resistance protein